jgi:hypothetical protein
MSKKKPVESVPADVHRFLSRNGKKGGQATKKLIEAGKRALEEEERITDEKVYRDEEERSSLRNH